jgi:hypothetical protein
MNIRPSSNYKEKEWDLLQLRDCLYQKVAGQRWLLRGHELRVVSIKKLLARQKWLFRSHKLRVVVCI